TSNPDANAYYGILDEKRRFLRSIGRGTGESDSPRTEALRQYKRALRFGDAAAATNYLDEYANLGGTQRGLEQSLRTMHPLHGLSREDQRRFYWYLDTEDRARLAKAIRYYEHVLLGRSPVY